MHSHEAVRKSLLLDQLRSDSHNAISEEDNDSDDDDDDISESKASCTKRTVSKSIRDAGKKVIKANAREGGVHTSMVLEHALQKLDRRRDKEHSVYIGDVLGNPALMSKTTSGLRAVRDPLFAEDFDRMNVFNVMARVLHQMKISVACTCWDQTVSRYQEELKDNRVKYESMRRVFQDSREAYLKEVATLRDQVRMRGDYLVDDELPPIDIVTYFDPEHVMLPTEQKFLLDAVKEKLKMMIERNPKVESCIDFGQFERLQNRVDSNELEDTKNALKRALAKLKEAEDLIAKKNLNRDNGKGATTAPPSNNIASEKVMEALEIQIEDLRSKLSAEQNALKTAKNNASRFEAERDDLSQSLRNMATEQQMHKTELNRMQERLLHYEPLASDAERDIAHLHGVIQAQEDELTQLRSIASRRASKETKPSTHEDFTFPDESLPSPADMAAGTRCRIVEKLEQVEPVDNSETIKQLQQMQAERDDALARCGDLTGKCSQMREVVRAQIEHFLELKSEVILDGAESIMEQAEILGCVCNESPEGVRVCGCGNVLVADAIFCRKCGTLWQKAAQMAKQLNASKDTLISLAMQLKDTDRKLDVAMEELRHVLKEQEGRTYEDEYNDVEWLERLMTVQNEVDSHQRQKLRLEAMLLETRVRVANRASLEMPIGDGFCTCSCAEELRATRKLLERTQHLCTESTANLQRAALENSVVNATLNKMRDTLGKAAGALQTAAVDNPDVRMCLKVLNEARAQSVFNRLYHNTDDSYRKERLLARRNRLLEESFHAIYQMDPHSYDVSKDTISEVEPIPVAVMTSQSCNRGSMKSPATLPPPKVKVPPPRTGANRSRNIVRESAIMGVRGTHVVASQSAPTSRRGSGQQPSLSSQAPSLPLIKIQTLSVGNTSGHLNESPPTSRPSSRGPPQSRSGSKGRADRQITV